MRSSARPITARARKSAVAGATTTTWAARARRMWSRAWPEAISAVCTGRPVRASKVMAPMNSCAAALMTTSTSAPACVSRRASHADL
jgi:hypothetical protein